MNNETNIQTVSAPASSLERVVRPGDEPYFIEVDNNGCTCGNGRTWTIVGPDGVATGQSWGDVEEAEYICELLNDAYQCGRGSNTRIS